MNRTFRLLAAAGFLLLAVAGPTRGVAADKKLTIAFSFQDLETEFWVAGHKAIIETLEHRGFKVIEKNAAKDANRQLEQVKSILTQKVDGIVIIPLDGEAAVTIGKLANQAGVPYAVFNRPPTNKEAKALVAVADNRNIAADAVEYMAMEAKKLGRKVTPAIMVGDLGDPNAVQRRQGFMDIIEKYPDLLDRQAHRNPHQVGRQRRPGQPPERRAGQSEHRLPVHQLGLPLPGHQVRSRAARQVDQGGDANHVLLGGVDGDKTACGLIRDGYLDATGVQDVYYEAKLVTRRHHRGGQERARRPRRSGWTIPASR